MSFYAKRKVAVSAQTKSAGTPEPSCVSDVSMGMPPEFSGGAVNSDPK